MRRLVIVISVGLIMAIVLVVGSAPTMAQQSPEEKAAKQQQKAAKQQKAVKAQQPLPASGGPPVGTIALYTLGASALVVGGGVLLVGRTVARR